MPRVLRSWVKDQGDSVSGPVPMRARVVIAAVIALLATVVCYRHLIDWNAAGADFTWAWRGAARLVAGLDPYNDPTISIDNPYPDDAPLRYPLVAVLLSIPFVPFPPDLAAALFFGISTGLLTFGLTRRGWAPLLTLASQPFFAAGSLAHWSPFILACALIPWLYPLLLVKPQLGLPVMAGFQRRRGIVIALGIIALGVAVAPNWFLEAVHNTQWGNGNGYVSPILILPGPLLLFSALHWRRPAGRLLLALSAAPQLPFTDGLLLWLIPRSTKQFLLLTASSWVAVIGWTVARAVVPPGHALHAAWPWAITFDFLPALGIVIVQSRGWVASETQAPQVPSSKVIIFGGEGSGRSARC